MSGLKFVRLEFFKSRRQHIFLLQAGLLSFLLIYFSATFSRKNAGTGWMDLVYTVPLIDSLVFPLGIAAIASRLCEAEHKGSTYKLLETMMPPCRLFDAKLACGAVHVGVLCLLQTALACALGAAQQFDGPFPAGRLLAMTGAVFAVSMLLFSLQLGLSLLLANQIIPLTVGVAGSFLGLFIMVFPQIVQRFLPWGYYGVLMLVRMEWEPATQHTQFFWADFDWFGLALLGVWLAVSLAVFRTAFARREV